MTKTLSLGRYATGKGEGIIEGKVNDNPFRMTFNLDRPSERYIYQCCEAFGAYEPEAVQRMISTLQPGDACFDVGAHCGYFSVIAKATVGQTGKVVSFEPDADNFKALQRNCQTILLNSVVGARQGHTLFYKNLDNDGGNSLWNPSLHPYNVETKDSGYTARMVRLDAFAHLHPTVIKIDTEGAEVEVLKGATETLRGPKLKLVIAELNAFGLLQMGSSEAELRAIMAAAGFTADASKPGVDNLYFTK